MTEKHEPPDWVKRVRGPDAELKRFNDEFIETMTKEEPRKITIADLPRLPRRIFIVCAFLPVMGWAVCDRWWEATRSMCFMIRCDWQEDWADMRKHWNL